MSRFVFVTGGVMSSLGKGIAASCIGALLKARNFTIKMKKLDPYINVDPGTMSPHKHGEVFVMEDGCEADLDFGHYERFTDITCSASDSITTGKIYEKVICKERQGDYLGSDIQVIPHITNEIKDFISFGCTEVDFTICEIGGTVGDIESFPYTEALRQLILEFGKERIICVHLSYLPFVKTAGELKTKPTQHSVKQLQSVGVQPDILLCRSEIEIPDDIKEKLAMFCNVKKANVVTALDAENIYLIPNQYHEEGLDKSIYEHFKIPAEDEQKINEKIKNKWESLVRLIRHPDKTVKVAVIGKYTKLQDAYISLTQAIMHGGFANEVKVDIDWINAEDEAEDIERQLRNTSGIIVPGGFSSRGIEGKIAAIKFARENSIPFLGICLGMQLAIIESCRNVAGITNATSREFSDEGELVIDFMESWAQGGGIQSRNPSEKKGGTMRLGRFECELVPDSLAHKVYGEYIISERHRHRYEVAYHKYRELIERAGIIVSGRSLDGQLVEMIERAGGHPWFLATQAHPEFKSRPCSPHPVFSEFVKCSCRLPG
ncbi:MAG: CTP synthase [Holosporales bacterium]|jgi:CTP synthase|nr:CTP synthase [Holosporales bacterium]